MFFEVIVSSFFLERLNVLSKYIYRAGHDLYLTIHWINITSLASER